MYSVYALTPAGLEHTLNLRKLQGAESKKVSKLNLVFSTYLEVLF